MINKGIFVTGTDTEAGKTIVTAALTAALRRAGLDAVPMKPVQTGAIGNEKGSRSPDLDFCLSAAGVELSEKEYRLLAPHCFELPASPHLAARKEERTLSVDLLCESFEKAARRHEVVVVEGVGGVLVPLNEREFVADLIERLGLPVVLAARTGLGTLNHTFLSIKELERRGAAPAGIVFCQTRPGPPGLIEKDNIETIGRISGVPVLGTIPFIEGLDSEREPPSGFAGIALSCLPSGREIMEKVIRRE